jgi:hypothetical protein
VNATDETPERSTLGPLWQPTIAAIAAGSISTDSRGSVSNKPASNHPMSTLIILLGVMRCASFAPMARSRFLG